ncbi:MULTISPECIES: hypothetical protein [Hyphomicrobiales]|uniref:hypothetical protein n=1 Tax=Methylobacterium sp. CCH7-A2 TaxID=1768789 RepID=UPI000A53633B|nr:MULTISPECIES: hypothetical protein [Hyphomicrobiales]
MLDPYLSLDGARAILVLLLAIAQPLMGYWPQLRRWPHTTPSRSARLQTPVVPIEWAFAIWGVIFTGCLGFAIWQLMPANLGDPLLREIGWLAIAVFSLTVAWEYYVPKHDLSWPSVGLIVATLACLLLIMVRLEAAEPHSTTTFWLVAAPFQLFAGWISAAVFVNASSTLRRGGSEQGTVWTIGFVAAAVVLGGIVAFASGAVIYVAAIAWALFGIVVANIVREPNQFVALCAGAAIPLVIAVALV